MCIKARLHGMFGGVLSHATTRACTLNIPVNVLNTYF
jgi:hypothetical protein